MSCNMSSRDKIYFHALRLQVESAMTRASKNAAVWLVAASIPLALSISFIAATARSDTLPDFLAYEAGPDRKAEFFEFLRPLVAAENERLGRDRKRLIKIASQPAFTWLDRWWIAKLSRDYRIDDDTLDDEERLATLLRRVDVVPISLALAQAAKESGWGTSRFAREANNLFGEWCFDPGCGLVPQARAEGRRHEVEAFASPKESVVSYMRNLNTHDRYLSFRLERARLRRAGVELSGMLLADELAQYSERRDDYINDIKHLIRVNKLVDGSSPRGKNGSTDAGG
jgi:Bax protein